MIFIQRILLDSLLCARRSPRSCGTRREQDRKALSPQGNLLSSNMGRTPGYRREVIKDKWIGCWAGWKFIWRNVLLSSSLWISLILGPLRCICHFILEPKLKEQLLSGPLTWQTTGTQEAEVDPSRALKAHYVLAQRSHWAAWHRVGKCNSLSAFSTLQIDTARRASLNTI